MNRTDRLVAMVTYLQGRRVVRAEELAAHFEVSERTVYRDVAALSEAGVPVVGEAGVGYSLVKGYHLPPVMFTAEEAMALAVAEDLVKQFTDRSLATPMSAAWLKIRSVLPREHQDRLEKLAAATAIELRGGAPADLDQRVLLPIQQAVVGRRVLRLGYRARTGADSEREVEPLGVVYFGDAWYLVAWCRLRDEYRHFKLTRIRSLQLCEERFVPRSEASLREHLRETVDHQPRVVVRAWFADAALERARRETVRGFLREHPAPEGGWVVELETYSIEWVARWLLSFGGEAEALEPAPLRQRVGEQARTVLEKHAELARS